MISNIAGARLDNLQQNGNNTLIDGRDRMPDVLSLSLTEGTIDSYMTALEETVSVQEEPATSIAQNNRVMNDLLQNVATEPGGSIELDTSKIGHLIQNLSFTNFDSVMENYVALLNHPFPDESYIAKRVRLDLRYLQHDMLTTDPRWYNIHFVDLRHILGSFEGPINSPSKAVSFT
jgi:hypothetical protein